MYLTWTHRLIAKPIEKNTFAAELNNRYNYANALIVTIIENLKENGCLNIITTKCLLSPTQISSESDFSVEYAIVAAIQKKSTFYVRSLNLFQINRTLHLHLLEYHQNHCQAIRKTQLLCLIEAKESIVVGVKHKETNEITCKTMMVKQIVLIHDTHSFLTNNMNKIHNSFKNKAINKYNNGLGFCEYKCLPNKNSVFCENEVMTSLKITTNNRNSSCSESTIQSKIEETCICSNLLPEIVSLPALNWGGNIMKPKYSCQIDTPPFHQLSDKVNMNPIFDSSTLPLSNADSDSSDLNIVYGSPKCFNLNSVNVNRQRKHQQPNSFSALNSLYIDFKKMFSTFLLPIILLCNFIPLISAECDQTFVSRISGPQNGTFTAPVINNVSNHSKQCLFIFLAGPGQRVEITFTSFNLRGTPPDGAAVGEIPSCSAEYMDIYSEVQSSDPADLINSPFGGRYCGPNLPRSRISFYRAIALSYFTSKNSTAAELFTGRYSFINASIYEIGTPITGSPCSFTITPHKNKSDVFISPTYPGAYPKDMFCTYHFIGESNQRVRLEFRDFDLFFGGPHCPFDFVKVFDGPDNSSALIGTYCGQQRNLVLYSSESSLLVHFFTLRRTASTQNRGFKGIYEFSEGFVKLDFIRENNGMHIRGSECDQKILSKRESFGLVYSPNYPFPYLPKTVCRYFIYGLQDAQHLERVRLEFSMFEIQKGEHKDKDKETNCTDGYLKVYLKGQETQDAYDKFDYELCGFDIPHSVVSDGPRLAMVFSSGELQARGFKAKYTFETEYKIPGTAAPDGSCSFTYKSTSRKKGEFNSPRFPSKYISDTNCTYMFLATPNEQVTIVFDHFKVKADNTNVTGGAYGALACSEDWLEMYVIFRDGSDRFLGRYCGNTAPGPAESPRGAIGIRIQLHTDAENVASGFKARYIFEVAKSVTGDCGGNYSGQESDIITSPNYPGKYHGPGKGLASRACNWYITARYGFRVSMNFEIFSVEGDPAGRGCPAAALRLWIAPDTDQAPVELCGDKAATEVWHYLSQGQSARISFITTDKTIGAQGFRIVWTEVQDTAQLSGPPSSIVHHCEPTHLHHCISTGYCISTKLRCDGVKNCGPNDDSDELNCIMEVTKDESGALIISSLAAGSFLICLVCTVYHRRKRRKPHHRQLGLHRSHYDSTTSATGLGSSRRHLQSGNSLSGSLHYGINSDDDILPIPQPPLPPTGTIPNFIINCTNDIDDDDDDDDDDDEDNEIDAEINGYNNDESEHHHQHHHQQINHIGGMPDDIFFSGSSDRFINVDSV